MSAPHLGHKSRALSIQSRKYRMDVLAVTANNGTNETPGESGARGGSND